MIEEYNVNENPTFYAIIPAVVRYDNDLSANAKLLYGEITALSNKNGCCWATNEYFAKLYNVNIRTITRWFKELADKNYIFIEIKSEKLKDGNIKKTRYVHIDKNVYSHIDKNVYSHIDKNVYNNNTSITNNTSKKKYIKKSSETFIPPTIEEIQNYCKERGNNVDYKKFYDYYNYLEWKDSNGKQIKSWKLKVILWENNNKKSKMSIKEILDEAAKNIV